jgi:hypothetical protein
MKSPYNYYILIKMCQKFSFLTLKKSVESGLPSKGTISESEDSG